jgi:hypothetical protein
MVIRYNFHIENFTRYPATGAVDRNVLESSLYIMKACPIMYTGLRDLRVFSTPIRLLIDPYYNTSATTSTPFHTHPSISRYNFTPHSSLHIPLQLHSSPSQHIQQHLHSSSIPTYLAATPTPSLFQKTTAQFLFSDACANARSHTTTPRASYGCACLHLLPSSLLSAAIPHTFKKQKHKNSVQILTDFLKSLETQSKQQYTQTGWNLTQSSLFRPQWSR